MREFSYIFVFLVILYSCDNSSGNNIDKFSDLEIQVISYADSLIETNNIPGIYISYSESGDKKWSCRRGKANISGNAAIDPDNYFRIGSITKTFTASLIWMLIEEGRISPDDCLPDFQLDNIDTNRILHSKFITVRQLLNMTSGLYNYSENEEIQTLFNHPEKSYTPQELIQMAYDKSPTDFPGQSYYYNNTSYVLLGLIIEKITGKKIEDYQKEKILAPYSLNNTFYPESSELPEPFTCGYIHYNGKNIDFTVQDPSWAWSAGAMVSTLSDMEKWSLILAGGKFLQQETIKERNKWIEAIHGIDTVYYGGGIFKFMDYYGHSGDIPGYMSIIMSNPDNKRTIVISMNNNNASIITVFKNVLTLIERHYNEN